MIQVNKVMFCRDLLCNIFSLDLLNKNLSISGSMYALYCILEKCNHRLCFVRNLLRHSYFILTAAQSRVYILGKERRPSREDTEKRYCK